MTYTPDDLLAAAAREADITRIVPYRPDMTTAEKVEALNNRAAWLEAHYGCRPGDGGTADKLRAGAEAMRECERLTEEVAFLRKCRAEDKAKIMRQKTALKQMRENLDRLKRQCRGLSRKVAAIQRSGDELAHSQYADLEARLVNQRAEIDRLRRAAALQEKPHD